MVKEVVKLTPIIFKLPKIKKIRVAVDARVSTEKDEQHNSLGHKKLTLQSILKNEMIGSLPVYITMTVLRCRLSVVYCLLQQAYKRNSALSSAVLECDKILMKRYLR